MDFQHLPDLQLVLGVDYPCALFQSLRPNIMVHPSDCAHLSLYAQTFLGKSRKDAYRRYLDILRIRIYNEHATDFTRYILI